MSKICILLLCLFSISLRLLAQEPPDNKGKFKLGLTFSSLGSTRIISIADEDGDPGYSGDNYYSIGLDGLFIINRILDFETGINYAWYKFNIKPYSIQDPAYNDNISLIYIPLSLRITVLKYLYLNGGLLLDFDMGNENSIDSQTGVGGKLGTGFNYDFNYGLSLFTDVYLNVHTLIPFKSEILGHKLFEPGLRIGILMRI